MLINVVLLKENEDGSAVYSFDLSEDVKDALLRFGILKAIEAGIEAAKELHPSFEEKTEWIGLTDAEVDNIVAYPWGETKNWIKAIEAKLKEKNA